LGRGKKKINIRQKGERIKNYERFKQKKRSRAQQDDHLSTNDKQHWGGKRTLVYTSLITKATTFATSCSLGSNLLLTPGY
jgi:hypothetical protein